VEKHLETIFRKLGVASRTEAAVLAIREGLV
jgi:DNA-binding NarL/FixJ family response regulator